MLWVVNVLIVRGARTGAGVCMQVRVRCRRASLVYHALANVVMFCASSRCG